MSKKGKKIRLKILMNDIESLRHEYHSRIEKIGHIKTLIFEDYIEQVTSEESENNETEKVETSSSSEVSNNKENNSTDNSTDNINDKNPDDIKETILEEIDDVNKPDKTEIKKIFRQIVLLTHPDKVKNKADAEYLKEIYIEAVKSYNDNDFVNILFLANKLEIDIDEISDSRIVEIEQYRSNLQRSVMSLDYDTLLVWYNTTNIDLKNVMLSRILKQFKNTVKKK